MTTMPPLEPTDELNEDKKDCRPKSEMNKNGEKRCLASAAENNNASIAGRIPKTLRLNSRVG
jgi:hypothetical protein